MSPFDIIKAARLAIANMDAGTGPSESSQNEYQCTATRIIGGSHLDAAQVIKRMTDTRKASTWFKNKAALQWYARKKIKNLLKAQDAIQRQLREVPDDAELREDWLSMVKVLDSYLTLLDRIPSGFPVPQEKRQPRHSKRKDLGGLPGDWREKILMHLEKYRLPYLAAAVTGCRPEEITRGIEFNIADGMLAVTIQGAKVTEKSGQPWRKMEWKLPRDGLVNILATEVRKAGGALTIHLDSPKNFSTNIRDTARMIWPKRDKTVTPYCLRHQFAADQKASGASDEDIAKAMGHTSTETAQSYGTARQSRGISVRPDRVEAKRDVKSKPKKIYVGVLGGKKG